MNDEELGRPYGEPEKTDEVLEQLSQGELLAETKRLRAENKVLRERLKFDATGLIRTIDEGRKFIFWRLEQARKAGREVTLFRLDLNGLKEKNKRFGSHDAVDVLLKKYAAELWKVTGEDGLAIRFHTKGDEFGVLVFSGDAREKERILRTGFVIDKEPFKMSVGEAKLGSAEILSNWTGGEVWDRLAEIADIHERRDKSGQQI